MVTERKPRLLPQLLRVWGLQAFRKQNQAASGLKKGGKQNMMKK